MTDRLHSLKALRGKVRAGEASGFDVSRCFYEIADLHALRALGREAFDGSLDAAKALHDAVLTGWGWCLMPRLKISEKGTSVRDAWICRVWVHGLGETEAHEMPSIAWFLAILSALIALEEGKA